MSRRLSLVTDTTADRAMANQARDNLPDRPLRPTGHRGSLKSSVRTSDSRASEYYLMEPVVSLRIWIGTPQAVTEYKDGKTVEKNLALAEETANVVLSPLNGGKSLEIAVQDISEIQLYHEIVGFDEVFPGAEDPRRCLKLKLGRSGSLLLEFASEMAVLKWVNGVSDLMSELQGIALEAVDGAASQLSTKDKAVVRAHLLAGAIVSRYTLEDKKKGVVFLEEPTPDPAAAPVGEDDPPMGRLCFCGNVHLRQVSESWDFADICDIYVGKQVAEFQAVAASAAPPTHCMSVVTEAEDGTPSGIHMEFKTAETLQTFLKAIADVLNGGGATIVEGKKKTEKSEEETVRRTSLLSPRFCDPKERRLTLTSSYLQDMERGIQVQVLTRLDMASGEDEWRFINARMVLDHSEHASRVKVVREEDGSRLLCIVVNNLRTVQTAGDVQLPETINDLPAILAAEDNTRIASFATVAEQITVKFATRDAVETWLSALSDVVRNGPQLVELTRSCGILLEGQDVHRHTLEEGRCEVFLYFEEAAVGDVAGMGRLCIRQARAIQNLVTDFALEVKDVSDIFVGKQAQEFRSEDDRASDIDEACCMSFVGELLVSPDPSSQADPSNPASPSFVTSTLHVEFPSPQLLTAWLRAITIILNGGGATILAGDAPSNQKMAEVGVGGQDSNAMSSLPGQRRKSSAPCSLSVRSPAGATIVIVDTENSDTIARIKEKIKELLFIEVNQQRLLYAGMELQNSHTLDFYQISNAHRSVVLLTAPEKPFVPKPIKLDEEVDAADLKLMMQSGKSLRDIHIDKGERDKEERSELQQFLPKKQISEQKKESYDENELVKQRGRCCFCS